MLKAGLVVVATIMISVTAQATKLTVIPEAALGGSNYGMQTTFDGATNNA